MKMLSALASFLLAAPAWCVPQMSSAWPAASSLATSILPTPVAGAGAGAPGGPSLATLTLPLPSQAGSGFTSTVSGCGTVSPFVIEGAPTGNFTPGTQTVFLPPQAAATSTTIVDPAFNVTEVLVATPLAGTCADFPVASSSPGPAAPAAPSPASSSAPASNGTSPTPFSALPPSVSPFLSPSPSPSPSSSPPPSESPSSSMPPLASNTACPLQGCRLGLSRAAKNIIILIDDVTITSQNLQADAAQIGVHRRRHHRPHGGHGSGSGSSSGRGWDEEHLSPGGGGLLLSERWDPLVTVVQQIKTVIGDLSFGVNTLIGYPAFGPGCDSDTIAMALINFIGVLEKLLEIIIGHASLLLDDGDGSVWIEGVSEGAAPSPAEEKIRRRVPAPGVLPPSQDPDSFSTTTDLSIAGGGEQARSLLPSLTGLLSLTLRGLGSVIDQLLYALVGLIPARSECVRQQKDALDETLQKAIAALSS